MDAHRPTILVLLAVALVWSMQLAGILGIFVLAFLAVTITEGLRRGALVPLSLGISRSQTPVKFWLILGACAAIILVNILNLFLRR